MVAITTSITTVVRCALFFFSSDPHHHGNHAEELDTGVYAQVGVDRFAILWDLWREEVKFLHAKMRVCKCVRV